jgi:Glycosyl hydrolase catalytic core
VFRGLLALVAVACAAVVIAVPSASAQPRMMIGFLDQASTFFDAEATFPTVQKLHAQVVRADLYWGGMPLAVARHKPTNAKDPADPAYNWAPFDHFVQVAAKHKVKILFTIWGTPRWANGGHSARYAPTKGSDLSSFAYAAAKHFSGQEVDENGVNIPAVRLWTAWNEPNQLFQLYPQYKRIKGKYVMVSAISYAKICNAVYSGVHATGLAGEKVACGVTAPRGNNNARGKRGTPSPQAFMIATRKAGLKKFDAYAHNPYNGPRELPTTKPHTKGAYTLGNIGDMIRQVTKLWGRKRIWLTEYAYQTNPPDRVFGVSYAKQALYLKQAFAIARKQPRVDMMLWFQVKDEPGLGGWQSGLITTRGTKKPAYLTYARLPH